MAISNVRSSAYRAAGGRAWNKVKGVQNGIRWDGPKSETELDQENQALAQSDEYYRTKEQVRKELEQGYDPDLIKVIEPGKTAPKKKVKRWWKKK